MPISKDFDGFEPSKSKALIIIFVSKTKCNYHIPLQCVLNLFTENIFQNIWCHATGFGAAAYFRHYFFK